MPGDGLRILKELTDHSDKQKDNNYADHNFFGVLGLNIFYENLFAI